jgi:hypothetical protein
MKHALRFAGLVLLICGTVALRKVTQRRNMTTLPYDREPY